MEPTQQGFGLAGCPKHLFKKVHKKIIIQNNTIFINSAIMGAINPFHMEQLQAELSRHLQLLLSDQQVMFNVFHIFGGFFCARLQPEQKAPNQRKNKNPYFSSILQYVACCTLKTCWLFGFGKEAGGS